MFACIRFGALAQILAVLKSSVHGAFVAMDGGATFFSRLTEDGRKRKMGEEVELPLREIMKRAHLRIKKKKQAKDSKDGNNDALSQIGNQKESDNILSPYSKISLQWLKALSPSLSFTEDDFIEIKNIIRLLSPSIHKMFQIYTGHLR